MSCKVAAAAAMKAAQRSGIDLELLEPHVHDLTLKAKLSALLLAEDSKPGLMVLLPDPDEWEGRHRPGLDLHWHCQHITHVRMGLQHEKLSRKLARPDEIEWRLCLPVDKAGIDLLDTVAVALVEAGGTEADGRRIAGWLKRRDFKGVRIIVQGAEPSDFVDVKFIAAGWLAIHKQLTVILALDGYNLASEELKAACETQLHKPRIFRLAPVMEDELRSQFLHILHNRSPEEHDRWLHGPYEEEDRLRRELLLLPRVLRRFALFDWPAKRKGAGLEYFERLASTDESNEPDASAEEKLRQVRAASAFKSHDEMQMQFDDAVWESFSLHSSVFVPVLGRGLNELCGIPTNIQIAEYLVFVAISHFDRKWNADSNQWPANPSPEDLKAALGKAVEGGSPPKQGRQNKDKDIHIWQSINTLLTAANEPLETVVLSRDGTPTAIKQPRKWPGLLMALCQQSNGGLNNILIENFSRRMMSGARPAALHTRLVHLIRPLRVRTVIDMVGRGILAQTLHRMHRRYEVIQTTDPLTPPPATGPVTDLTVVEWPGSLDRTAALKYVDTDNTEATPPEVEALWSWFKRRSKSKNEPPRCFLLLGVTGNGWWESLLDRLLPRLQKWERIFVVMETTEVRERLVAKFGPYLNDRRLCLRVASRPDLLLYEMYVRTANSLPPGSYPYGFQHAVPPHHMPVAFQKQATFDQEVTHLVSIARCPGEPAGRAVPGSPQTGRYKELPLVWIHGRAGVISIASRAYWQMSQEGSRCLWVGLNDFGSTLEVERYIVQQMAAMAGIGRQASLSLASEEPLAAFLDYVTDNQQLAWPITFRRAGWVVFVEARGIPGLDASVAGSHLWNQEELAKLEERVLETLAKRGVHVVYLPMSRKFAGALLGLIQSHCKTLSKKIQLRHFPCSKMLPADIDPGDTSEDSVEILKPRAEEWINERCGHSKAASAKERWQRAVFLYSLTLFRESRHLSAITSEAVHTSLDWLGRLFDTEHDLAGGLPASLHEFATKTEPDYRTHLRRLGIIRWQRGAFVHIPWLLREALRDMLEEGSTETPAPTSPITGRTLKESRAAVHFRISEWYAEAFRSSQDPAALIECLFHQVKTVEHSQYAKAPNRPSSRPKSQAEAHQRYSLMLALIGLLQLSKKLRVAQGVIRLHPELAYRLGEDASTGVSPVEVIMTENPLLRKRLLREHVEKVRREILALVRLVNKESGRAYDASMTYPSFHEHQAAGTLNLLVDTSQAHPGHHMPSALERRYTEEHQVLNQMISRCLTEIGARRLPPRDQVQKVQLALLQTCPFDMPLKWQKWQDAVYVMARSFARVARNALLQAKEAAWQDKRKKRHQIITERGYYIVKDPKDPVYSHLVTVIKAAVLAHRIAWLLPLSQHDAQLHVSLRAYASACVALARLGRFTEAHRMLNSATGYLGMHADQCNPVERGRLKLRRSEIFLLQASKKGIGEVERAAHLQDALYWARLGGQDVLTSSQHGQWLSHALLLEADVIQRCLHLRMPMGGGADAPEKIWLGHISLACQLLLRRDRIARRRLDAMCEAFAPDCPAHLKSRFQEIYGKINSAMTTHHH